MFISNKHLLERSNLSRFQLELSRDVVAIYPTFGVRVWAVKPGFIAPLDDRPVGNAGAPASVGPPDVMRENCPIPPPPAPSHWGVSVSLPERGKQNEITVVFTAVT